MTFHIEFSRKPGLDRCGLDVLNLLLASVGTHLVYSPNTHIQADVFVCSLSRATNGSYTFNENLASPLKGRNIKNTYSYTGIHYSCSISTTVRFLPPAVVTLRLARLIAWMVYFDKENGSKRCSDVSQRFISRRISLKGKFRQR